MENNFDEIYSKNESKNPKNYRGIFYFNKKDSRIIVPKWQSSRGWTINFGNPLAYVFIILLIGLLILLPII